MMLTRSPYTPSRYHLQLSVRPPAARGAFPLFVRIARRLLDILYGTNSAMVMPMVMSTKGIVDVGGQG